jgi:predicted transcriptional regulator YdeE
MLTQVEITARDLQAKETAPFTALGLTTRATLRTLSRHAANVPPALHAEILRLGLDITGPMQWLYTGVNGDETNEFTLDIVVPVRAAVGEPDGFTFREIPAFSCLSYTHLGPWSEFPAMYDVLFAEIYRGRHRVNDLVREVYKRVDLENPTQCITDIQVGLVAEG